MSKWDKLLWKIFHLSNDLRFDEVKKVLEYFGFVMEGKKHGGSHRTFRKEGRGSITIPQKDPVNRCYVRYVKEAIQWEIENEKS